MWAANARADITLLTFQDSLVNYGKNYLGVPYRYGGNTPKGFDCSGFTSYVFKEFGCDLKRSSREQALQFPTVQKKDLQTGDLVFFEGRRKNKVVGHVGIVTDIKPDGEFDFIHASVKYGVTVSSSTQPYYASRYLKAGRAISNNNTASLVRNASYPTVFEGDVASGASQPLAQKNIAEPIYHTVKRGENLASISRQYDVPISTIRYLNNLPSKRIKRGQKLLITQAVNLPLPSMPIAEVRKVDYDKTAERNEKQYIALEPLQKEENSSFVGEDASQQKIFSDQSESSQRLEQPEKEQAVVEEEIQQISPQPARKHKVTAGESLFSIARRYNLTVDRLKSMNNLSSNTIKAGQILVVGVSSITPETEPVESAIHTVRGGDTLYSIARQYGCSVSDLRKWNPGLRDAIKIGESIRIAE